jgi:hypothetical protein
MGINMGSVERQFDDIFDRTAYGFTTATTGAITTGNQVTVSINVPGVTLPATGNAQPWASIAEWTSVSIGALTIWSYVSAANTVTMIISNDSGGTITPPANTVYGVVFGRLNLRFATPNVAGGTTG